MKVWFRCDGKNADLFLLNTQKDIEVLPMVGDFIKTQSKDFTKASFRTKPYHDEPSFRNSVVMDFKVVSREYSLPLNEWILICEPTPKSLLYLLKSVKVK